MKKTEVVYFRCQPEFKQLLQLLAKRNKMSESEVLKIALCKAVRGQWYWCLEGTQMLLEVLEN